MTATHSTPTTALPGRPPVVDLATWQVARDELLVREKAHTREGDALAAARRQLPMVEIDGTVAVVGPDGPIPFVDLFEGREELVVYQQHMARRRPAPGPVRGLHVDRLAPAGRGLPQRARRLVRDPHRGPVGRGGAVRGVHGLHPALVLGARAGRAGRRRDGLPQRLPARRRPGFPHVPLDGPRDRADQPRVRPARPDALRPSRGVGGDPEGWPEGNDAGWFWRTDADGVAGWSPTTRPAPQWTRPGATPVEALGRHEHHH